MSCDVKKKVASQGGSRRLVVVAGGQLHSLRRVKKHDLSAGHCVCVLFCSLLIIL